MEARILANKGKVLIADELELGMIPGLEGLGYEVSYQPQLKRAEIIEQLKGCVGLVIRSKTYVDRDLLQKATSLRFIARAGAGLDLIDLDFVAHQGILLFAANEGNKVAVAEHIIGMILALFNNLLQADTQVREGVWKREANRGIELMGKKVGIIGYGHNGRETAKKFRAFGCEVLAYDKYKSNFSDEFAKEVGLNELFAQSEILSLHIPLTPETNRWINKDFIYSFHQNIYFVNASRGEIVVLKDLLEALESGKVRGACLDVLENEKFNTFSPEQKEVFQQLSSLSNIVFSPHIAGWTHESYRKINEVLLKQIAEKC